MLPCGVGVLALASAVVTVPFLSRYQVVTALDREARPAAEMLVVRYVQVREPDLPREERPHFRDLLQRVRYGYGELDARGRAQLVREYLMLASRSRSGPCSEALLRAGEDEGLRYRICVSTGGGVIRRIEDLNGPDTLLWRTVPATLSEGSKPLAAAVLGPLMAELRAARESGDTARVRALEAEIQRATEELDRDLPRGETVADTVRIELNGFEEELERTGFGQVEAALARLWAKAEVSPGFSRRLALLLHLLLEPPRAASEAARLELDPALRFVDAELDPGRLPRELRYDGPRLRLKVTGPPGPLPMDFLPLPEELGERFYPRGGWDPPDPRLTFDERVERLSRGKGW